jgi:hypothetical protein
MPALTRAVLTWRARSQEDDDALSADKFIQKAGFLLSESKDEALELQYNTCYARILDSKARPPRGSASAGWLAHSRCARTPRLAAKVHRGRAALLPPQPAGQA